MNRRGTPTLMAMLLALASGHAAGASAPPLRLGFVAPPERHAAMRAERIAAASSRRASPMAQPATPPLRERALESILDPPSAALTSLDENPSGGQMQLRFQKRGNAFRDLGKGYREMCDKASAKLWDEPNGKRVRFDVRGKPGVGIEIPIR